LVDPKVYLLGPAGLSFEEELDGSHVTLLNSSHKR